MGLFELLAEDVRAQDAALVLAGAGVTRLGADDRYWQAGSYNFTLHDPTVPEPIVFPLVLNPQTIRKSHPFAAELTPAQEGGVMAEENGVLISELTISGHTGVRPRLNAAAKGLALPLSGQAHFLWLQDACFLRYSQLKKDPKTASKTYMTWHNLKDGEHWVCIPRNLTVERSKDKNFQYSYSIQVALIEEIQNQKSANAEDNELFVSMKDAIRNIAAGLALVESTIRDIENFESSISRTTAQVLADITAAVGAVNLFVSGQASFVKLPQRTMLTLATQVDTVMQIADPNKILSIPYDYTAAWLDIQDGLLRIASYPEKFREDFDASRQRFLQLVNGAGGASTSDLEAAGASTITQASQLENSGLRPGDLQRVRAGVFDLPLTLPRYLGFREIAIAFGDTLPSIAAREMGDARRWLDIALANELQAPYISEEGLPFTRRPGDSLLIPTTEATQAADTVRTAGDPTDRASQLAALFGTDLKMAPAGNGGGFDFVVDRGSGTDIELVSGVANIEQTVVTILSVEKGAYLLHQNVGVDRIAGRPGTVERLIEARSRVVEAVQRDPRIAKVKNAGFHAEKDALEITLEVETVDSSPIRVIGRVIS